MKNDDFYDYYTGLISGQGTGIWGSLGNMEYENMQNTRESTYSTGSTPSYSSGGGGSSTPSPAAEFAEDWTDEICDWIADRFEGLPKWVGRTARLAFGLTMMVVAFARGFEIIPILVAPIIGWYLPDVLIGAFKIALFVSLALLYVVFWFCIFALVVGAVVGTLCLLV